MPTMSTRASVASALSQAGSVGMSGEVLAAQLGVSRVAVSRHVATLRELGYSIGSAPRAGYRLHTAPDSCIPEEVAPLLRHPLWVGCEGAASMPSTSDEAKRRARSGAPGGTVVVAGRQTGGRGRFGRTWESPGAGVYASVVLRPEITPADASPLPLVVALGAAVALEGIGVEAGLKWPNDIVAGERKLGGILLEMAAEADSTEWVVAGIGVNVSDPGHDRAAWVREQVPDVRVPVVAAALLDGMASAYAEFCRSGFAALREGYERRMTLKGEAVTVKDLAGSIVAEGLVVGIDPGGALVVEGGAGLVAVHGGDVTLRA